MCGRRPLPRGRNLPPPRKTLQRRRGNNRRNNRNSRQVASRGCRVIVGFAGDPFREPCIVVRLREHRIVARIRGPHVVVRFRGRGEMVDARDLKSLGGNPVRVRVPPSAPGKSRGYVKRTRRLADANMIVSTLYPQNFWKTSPSGHAWAIAGHLTCYRALTPAAVDEGQTLFARNAGGRPGRQERDRGCSGRQ